MHNHAVTRYLITEETLGVDRTGLCLQREAQHVVAVHDATGGREGIIAKQIRQERNNFWLSGKRALYILTKRARRVCNRPYDPVVWIGRAPFGRARNRP